MRIGRISYINCFPVYQAIDRGIVTVDAELVTGTPSELNDLLAANALDVSVVSAVEYARNAKAYHLLPNLAISCDGPVQSVALFSRKPVTELDGATVILSASSKTSVHLLELLCLDHWGVAPRFVTARAEGQDLDALAELPHEAVLVIGDAALLLSARGTYPLQYDLGKVWKDWTGLPFVFAVWAARREANQSEVGAVHARLLESRDWGLAHLDDLSQVRVGRHGDCLKRRLPGVSQRPRLCPFLSPPGRTHELLPAAGFTRNRRRRNAVVPLGSVRISQ